MMHIQNYGYFHPEKKGQNKRIIASEKQIAIAKMSMNSSGSDTQIAHSTLAAPPTHTARRIRK